eukprot:Pgem_evm1s17441
MSINYKYSKPGIQTAFNPKLLYLLLHPDETYSILFEKFLKSSLSSENLLFWRECQKFKNLNNHHDLKAKVMYSCICDEFIRMGAPLQVNLDQYTREGILNRGGAETNIESDGNRHTFDSTTFRKNIPTVKTKAVRVCSATTACDFDSLLEAQSMVYDLLEKQLLKRFYELHSYTRDVIPEACEQFENCEECQNYGLTLNNDNINNRCRINSLPTSRTSNKRSTSHSLTNSVNNSETEDNDSDSDWKNGNSMSFSSRIPFRKSFTLQKQTSLPNGVTLNINKVETTHRYASTTSLNINMSNNDYVSDIEESSGKKKGNNSRRSLMKLTKNDMTNYNEVSKLNLAEMTGSNANAFNKHMRSTSISQPTTPIFGNNNKKSMRRTSVSQPTTPTFESNVKFEDSFFVTEKSKKHKSASSKPTSKHQNSGLKSASNVDFTHFEDSFCDYSGSSSSSSGNSSNFSNDGGNNDSNDKEKKTTKKKTKKKLDMKITKFMGSSNNHNSIGMPKT